MHVREKTNKHSATPKFGLIGAGMLVALVLLFGGYFILQTDSPVSKLFSSQAAATSQWGTGEDLHALFGNSSRDSGNGEVQESVSTTLTPEEIRQYLTRTYKNEALGFGFRYPDGFRIGSFRDTPEQTTILLQHTEKRVGLQIVITELEERVELSDEYIAREIPSVAVLDPQPVRIGGERRGLVFLSRNEAFGESREIWFTHRGHLYQVSSYATLDPFVKAVFSTWEFS